VSGNEVTILQPEEQLALVIARNQAARGVQVGPNTAAVLVATIDRLAESQPNRRRYWLTEQGEQALDGAR
jgi:hypothetical protein